MKCAIRLITVLLTIVPGVIAHPQFRNAGATLVAESQPNNAVESGENVTVRLALKNVGFQVASNLVATIQTGNGVSNPTQPLQSYGLLAPCAPSQARNFAFTCTAPIDSLLTVTLALEDSGVSLGRVDFRFRVGPYVSHAENAASFMINAVGPAATYPSVLSVSNATGTIVKVSVTLSNLSHSFPDDLDILLVSPGNDRVMLMSDACGGADLDELTLTFTDDTPTTLPDTTVPSTTVVRPTNYGVPDALPLPAPSGPYAAVMSAFNGKNANGDWKLYIVDDANDDGGMLDGGWSLTIMTALIVDGAPTLVPMGRSTNNMIRFYVSGRPGYPYAIESSMDPVQSSPLESFQMPLSGTRIFEYPLGSSNRFFRAVTNP